MLFSPKLRKNYIGKNPMIHTQWRRHQRNKKASPKDGSANKNNVVKALLDVQKATKILK